MLDRPLSDVSAYVAFLSGASLPVLRQTQRQVEALRSSMDRVNARDLSRVVLHDPMMAAKVLNYIQPYRGKSLRSDITTVGGAILMLGIDPFFSAFATLPTIEERLDDHPEAILGVLRLIRRFQRAAGYAHEWALWRHDLNIEEVTLAALLHDLAELLVWVFAPAMALEIRARQQSNPTLRSATVQRDVLGLEVHELQNALCRAWDLPELLQSLIEDSDSDNPRVRNVRLAVDLARHSANGWTDPALADDFRAIAALLGLSVENVVERVGAREGVSALGEQRQVAPPKS